MRFDRRVSSGMCRYPEGDRSQRGRHVTLIIVDGVYNNAPNLLSFPLGHTFLKKGNGPYFDRESGNDFNLI